MCEFTAIGYPGMDTMGEPFIWSTDAPDSVINGNGVNTKGLFEAGVTNESVGTWTVWATPVDPHGLAGSATIVINPLEPQESYIE